MPQVSYNGEEQGQVSAISRTDLTVLIAIKEAILFLCPGL